MECVALEDWAGESGPEPRTILRRDSIVRIVHQGPGPWWRSEDGWVPATLLRRADAAISAGSSVATPVSPKSNPFGVDLISLALDSDPEARSRQSSASGPERHSATELMPEVADYEPVDHIEESGVWIPVHSKGGKLLYIDTLRHLVSDRLLFAPWRADQNVPLQVPVPECITKPLSYTTRWLNISSGARDSSSNGAGVGSHEVAPSEWVYRQPEFVGTSLSGLRHTKGEFVLPAVSPLLRELLAGGTDIHCGCPSNDVQLILEHLIDASTHQDTENGSSNGSPNGFPNGPSDGPSNGSAVAPRLVSTRQSESPVPARSAKPSPRPSPRPSLDASIEDQSAQLSPSSSNEHLRPHHHHHLGPAAVLDSAFRGVGSALRAMGTATRALESATEAVRSQSLHVYHGLEPKLNESTPKQKTGLEHQEDSSAILASTSRSRAQNLAYRQETSEDTLDHIQDPVQKIGCALRCLGKAMGIPLGAAPALATGKLGTIWRLAINSAERMRWAGAPASAVVEWALQFIEEANRHDLHAKRRRAFAVAYFDCVGAEWSDVVWDSDGTAVVDAGSSTRLALEACSTPRACSPALTEDLATHAQAVSIADLSSELELAHARAACLLAESVDIRPFAGSKVLDAFLSARQDLLMGMLQPDRADFRVAINRLAESQQRLVKPPPMPLEIGEELQIVCDNQGRLRGGTKRALVQEITRHDSRRSEMTAAFLMTYPAFMTGAELVDFLQDRFAVLPSLGLERIEYESWLVQVQQPVRFRVVNVLKQWIDVYWASAEQKSRDMQIRLARFVDRLVQLEFPGSGVLAASLALRQAGVDEANVGRKSSLSAPLQLPYNLREHTPGQLTVDDVPLAELARQMTLRKWVHYVRIRPRECLWRSSAPDSSDSVGEFVADWNLETCWVAQLVLTKPDPQLRATRIETMIELAKECRHLNNFSTMMAVIAALYSAAVYRLKDSWALVRAQYIADFEAMCRLMNSSRNFSEYRAMLSLVHQPTIPFLGVCLTDLRFTLDGNPDCLSGQEDLVNFTKWSMCARIIDDALRFQPLTYPLMPIPEVQEMLTQEITNCIDLDEQYQMSLEAEPHRKRP